jgi:hypothetical protein
MRSARSASTEYVATTKLKAANAFTRSSRPGGSESRLLQKARTDEATTSRSCGYARTGAASRVSKLVREQ